MVSDGASAMQLAKRLISDEYPRIMPVRCIAHHVQLICTDIIKKISFANNIFYISIDGRINTMSIVVRVVNYISQVELHFQ